MDDEVFSTQAVTVSLGKYFNGVLLDIESVAIVKFNGERLSEESLAKKFRAFQTPLRNI
ncbi:hypothetical protein LQ318_09980 [Aliifodinibius salicampi]|uniref:Uncharacterized protein n=1 Tax=Fodinibius salicampi TaxID=1920655 RepID=A0ABT3PZE0_9BACT|nr:hypothetical protein [Fodinibius salicampi]MCW9713233.1 hypothetical protein [Fodinibius salicampi]